MKNVFKFDDQKTFEVKVSKQDIAGFGDGTVHPVYSTFALGRDAEWCCRLFVLEMKEEDEEGIGTYLSIDHISPALQGSIVKFTATIIRLIKNEIICAYEAKVGDRLIAKGVQIQKIIKKEKLDQIFKNIS